MLWKTSKRYLVSCHLLSPPLEPRDRRLQAREDLLDRRHRFTDEHQRLPPPQHEKTQPSDLTSHQDQTDERTSLRFALSSRSCSSTARSCSSRAKRSRMWSPSVLITSIEYACCMLAESVSPRRGHHSTPHDAPCRASPSPRRTPRTAARTRCNRRRPGSPTG